MPVVETAERGGRRLGAHRLEPAEPRGRGLDGGGVDEWILARARLEARDRARAHERDPAALVDARKEHRRADAGHLDEAPGRAAVQRSNVLGADALGGGPGALATLALGGHHDASTDALVVQQEGAGGRMGRVEDFDGGSHFDSGCSKRQAHTL